MNKKDFEYDFSVEEHRIIAFSYAGEIKKLITNGKEGFKWEPEYKDLRYFLENLWVDGLEKVPDKFDTKMIKVIDFIPYITLSLEEFLSKFIINDLINMDDEEKKNVKIEFSGGRIKIYKYVLNQWKSYLNKIWYKMTRIDREVTMSIKRDKKREKEESLIKRNISYMKCIAEKYGYTVTKKV